MDSELKKQPRWPRCERRAEQHHLPWCVQLCVVRSTYTWVPWLGRRHRLTHRRVRNPVSWAEHAPNSNHLYCILHAPMLLHRMHVVWSRLRRPRADGRAARLQGARSISRTSSRRGRRRPRERCPHLGWGQGQASAAQREGKGRDGCARRPRGRRPRLGVRSRRRAAAKLLLHRGTQPSSPFDFTSAYVPDDVPPPRRRSLTELNI